MDYNYCKLRGKIKEILGGESKLASLLNISNASMSGKLNSKIPFSLKEMDTIIILLDIRKEEIYDYFFTKKVEKYSTR